MSKHTISLFLLITHLLQLFLQLSVLLSHSAMLLLVVDNLLNQQICILLLARELNFQMLFLFLESSVFTIKLLGHVGHKFELLVERLLT